MKKRILFADDDADILDVVSCALKRLGYEVIRAEEGDEALAKIRELKPDLVLLDYFMPGRMGDDICRVMKSDDSLKAIPIIVLSASMGALTPEKIRAIPCDDSLTKPFEMPALAAKIARLLQGTSSGDVVR